MGLDRHVSVWLLINWSLVRVRPGEPTSKRTRMGPFSSPTPFRHRFDGHRLDLSEDMLANTQAQFIAGPARNLGH